MVIRIGVVALAATTGFNAAFFLYGEIRAMSETIGVSLRSTAFAIAFVTVYAWGPAVLAYWVGRRVRREPLLPWARWLRVFTLGILVGCVTSEAALLWDEARFADEAARAPGVAISRARAWPFGGSGLVYDPGEGIHSTD